MEQYKINNIILGWILFEEEYMLRGYARGWRQLLKQGVDF